MQRDPYLSGLLECGTPELGPELYLTRLPDPKLPVGLAYTLQPIEGPAPLKRKTNRS